ncbi:MAG: threonylcarbamoyl-AMP synthase [Chitinivibrionales bacterium]|nr:threonylcarbamoyl-AMP synthase [Chitinivibrionales bacterium]
MPAERISLNKLQSAPAGSAGLVSWIEKIERGAVFVYPTETIYGIGGRADSENVAAGITAAKKRPLSNPMIRIASRKEILDSLPVVFTTNAKILAKKFWPGYLTLVLPGEGQNESIAVRLSSHPFISRINEHLKVPLFSTSANISGEKYVNDPDVIFDVFKHEVDFMVDAGVLAETIPSTVVKISGNDSVTIIREGAISAELIRNTVRI